MNPTPSQQIEVLTKQLSNVPIHSVNNIQNHQVQTCDFCGGNNPNRHCSYPEPNHEELQFVNNQPRQGNFSKSDN